MTRDANAVRIEVRGHGTGPTLALASHLDVVPPGAGWTRDPFTPVIEGTRLYGRGSGDAKASVAAMLYAAKDLVDSGGIDAGRLLLLFGYGEETKNTTMGSAVEAAGQIDAAVIGEPTGLDFAIAQRGPDDGGSPGPGRPASRRLRFERAAASPTPRWCSPATCSSSMACSGSAPTRSWVEPPPRPRCSRPGWAGTSPRRSRGRCWTSAARPIGPTRSSPMSSRERSPRT